MEGISSEGDKISWNDLLKRITDSLKSKEINKDQIIRLLSSYKSKEVDWHQYAYFGEKFYTRNLVDAGNGIYNLMILAWNPAQSSCIHDHANSSCFVKILAGALREIR